MSTHIIEELLSNLPEKEVPVRSVMVGVHWTAVCSSHCGLATTFAPDKPHDHSTHVRNVGNLHQKSAQELAKYALSKNTMEAGIGIAAINSLLEFDENDAVEVNASEVLMEQGAGKNVAIVGHFPFIPKVKKAVKNLWVIEQNPVEGDHPAHAASDIIPRADVVAITGSSLINHTLDDLLGLCKPEALVVILGPSTPISPVIFVHGANINAGSKVIDETAVLNAISQGATFQQVTGVKLLAFTSP